MYGQVDEIFCCLEGFNVRVSFGEGLPFVDDNEASVHPYDDIFVFGIHLISQERVLRLGKNLKRI